MKYEKLGFAITVPVNENYSVRANILRVDGKNNTYDFTLEISNNESGLSQLIGEDEVYRMESTRINSDVADYILRLNKEGFFKPIIEVYEYITKFVTLGLSNYDELMRK